MIIAGFGFRASASMGSLFNALEKACSDRSVTKAEIRVIAVPEDKIESPEFRKFCEYLSIVATPVPAGDMIAADTLTQSPRVQDMRGTGSVAEASALSAAGPAGQPLGPRVVSDDRMATCALAKGDPS